MNMSRRRKKEDRDTVLGALDEVYRKTERAEMVEGITELWA